MKLLIGMASAAEAKATPRNRATAVVRSPVHPRVLRIRFLLNFACDAPETSGGSGPGHHRETARPGRGNAAGPLDAAADRSELARAEPIDAERSVVGRHVA